jgi:glyoxylase-like metal-dependent hydrolase (beta-lactamase superfamily II)
LEDTKKDKQSLQELLSNELEFEYAISKEVIPGIRRIVAPNPSPYTLYGTGTYIIGSGEIAIIDPGPNISSHIDAIITETKGEKITHIFVTHTHADHSPAARPLANITGALVMGFGPHGNFEGEEGADLNFVPDYILKDKEIIKGANWELECIHTPGHTSNHICYSVKEANAVLTGDHIMGWSTTLVSPPDGNMKDYFASLEKMLLRDDKYYIPSHGKIIKKPKRFVKALIGHRKMREKQITKYLDNKKISYIPDLVKKMYPHIDKRLIKAAGRSVLAHLLYMQDLGYVKSSNSPNGKGWVLL